MIEPRSSWKPKANTGPPLPRTPDEVWLHWAVIKPSADPYADMRKIEAIGIQRFGRFSYSYCYHPPTRKWLEGAGQTVGAHTGGRNSRALGLSIIAAPGADDMPHLAEDTAALIRHLIDTDKLAPGRYPTGGHRDQKATECPGNVAYGQLDTIRRLVANPTTPEPEEPDMTPEQATQLAELHAAFIGNDKAPKPGAFRRVLQLLDSRTFGLADKAGVKPNPKN